MLERIKKHLNLKAWQEECRKLGVNFVIAGIVGIFLNHYAGPDISTMFWTAFWITCIGAIFLMLGLFKPRGNEL